LDGCSAENVSCPAKLNNGAIWQDEFAAEGDRGKSVPRGDSKGVDGGVFEIALKYRGDAYRTIYAVQLGPDLPSACPGGSPFQPGLLDSSQ
jgi:hypothetical protein